MTDAHHATTTALAQTRRGRARSLAVLAAVLATAAGVLGLAPVRAEAAPACAACAAQTDQTITAEVGGSMNGYTFGGASSGSMQLYGGGTCAAAGYTALPNAAELCSVYGSGSFWTSSALQGSMSLSLSIGVGAATGGFDRSYSCSVTIPYDWEGPDNGAVSGTCTVYFASGATRTDTVAGRASFLYGDLPVYLGGFQQISGAVQLVTQQS